MESMQFVCMDIDQMQNIAKLKITLYDMKFTSFESASIFENSDIKIAFSKGLKKLNFCMKIKHFLL